MKKLNKLLINPERLMKNEELKTLRGGYGGACCWCFDNNMNPKGAMAATNQQDCQTNCWLAGQWLGFYLC